MVLLSLSGNYTRISSDDSHFYIIGDSGLDIINKDSRRSEGFVTFAGGFNDVWAGDSAFLYLAADDGLYFLEKPQLFKLGEDLTDTLAKDGRTDLLQSAEVISIAGLDRDNIVLGTISGVEVLNEEGVHHSNQFSPVTSVAFTSSFDIFYGGSFGLAFKKGPIITNWSLADNHIVFPFIPNNDVKDLDVSSKEEDHVVGVATASGVVLIQQRDPLFLSPTTKFFTESSN
jgi:hypothetical protein